MNLNCGECGGNVELVNYASGPANATEGYECLDCENEGIVYYSSIYREGRIEGDRLSGGDAGNDRSVGMEVQR